MHAIRSQRVVICLLIGLSALQPSWAQSPPERGLDKSAVETRFGAPQRVEGPVGEPPITKWVYTDFIVVFEYDHVVHTVKRQPVVEQAPVGEAAPPAQTQAPASGASGPAGTPAAEPEASADRQATGDTLNIPQ